MRLSHRHGENVRTSLKISAEKVVAPEPVSTTVGDSDEEPKPELEPEPTSVEKPKKRC